MTPTLNTCPHCGAVLLWVHGTLACARRDCATQGGDPDATRRSWTYGAGVVKKTDRVLGVPDGV